MQGLGMRGGGTQGSLCRPGPGPREPGSPRSETGYSPSGDGGAGEPQGSGGWRGARVSVVSQGRKRQGQQLGALCRQALPCQGLADAAWGSQVARSRRVVSGWRSALGLFLNNWICKNLIVTLVLVGF